MHFPHVPLIAVTATASERVRDDCARILRIGTNFQLFRSTANRNNLNYSIRPKPDGAQKVIDNMVDFIKTHHPNNAGIIYCFSKKEAEDVADKLCTGGIVARPYHADISQGRKDQTQRSWQRNQTQVVVGEFSVARITMLYVGFSRYHHISFRSHHELLFDKTFTRLVHVCSYDRIWVGHQQTGRTLRSSS